MNGRTLTQLFLTALFMATASLASASSITSQKIVALSPHSVELLYAIGVGDRIVATTDAADYPQAAKLIPRVGGHHGVQIERILELSPDIIIVWEGGNKPTDIAQLEQLGMNVYRSNTQNIDDIPKELRQLGELTGREDEAEKLARDFELELSSLRARYQQQTPVSFFYQLWSDPLRGMAEGSWINEVLEGCGGYNVLRGTLTNYPDVSLESIIVLQPQVIFQPSHPNIKPADEQFWQAWQEVPAVANQRIFSINGDLMHRFSTRILEGMTQVCEQLEQVRQEL